MGIFELAKVNGMSLNRLSCSQDEASLGVSPKYELIFPDGKQFNGCSSLLAYSANEVRDDIKEIVSTGYDE